MDEHAALKMIFEAHKVVVEKRAICEDRQEAYKEAKNALDEAQTILNERIQEARIGQEMLPFEGAGGKTADDARLDDGGEGAAPVPPAEAAKRKRKKV